MGNNLKDMIDVSSTLLITLYARAKESKSANPIIQDTKAIEIIDIVKKELAGSHNPIHEKIISDKYNSKLAVTMALRSRRFDQYVLDFMKDNPNGTVINFGCGLDTRFDRIDNGTIKWFDIDFPEVIELRHRFFKENNRHAFLAGSILDAFWINKVKTGGPYLILAEGVFMYLKEEEVQELLAVILRELKNVDLVCEVTNSFLVKNMKSKYLQWKFKHQLGITGGAEFTFGIPNSMYFEKWNKNYKLMDEWTYFDDNEKKLGIIRLFSKIEILRKVQWTIHYKIGK